MKTSFTATLMLSICVAISGVSSAQQTTTQQQSGTQQSAQQNLSQQQGLNTATAKQPAVVKKVGFRLTSWRTVHGDGTQATTDMALC